MAGDWRDVYRRKLQSRVYGAPLGDYREGLLDAIHELDILPNALHSDEECGTLGPFIPASNTQLKCELAAHHVGLHTTLEGRPVWKGKPHEPVTKEEIKFTVQSLLALQQDLETHG